MRGDGVAAILMPTHAHQKNQQLMNKETCKMHDGPRKSCNLHDSATNQVSVRDAMAAVSMERERRGAIEATRAVAVRVDSEHYREGIVRR